MTDFAATYALLPDAAGLAGKLIAQLPEFNHLALAQPPIAYVLSQPPLILHGVPAQACIGPARVQAVNAVKGLYEFLLEGFTADGAEFLMFFDATTWAVLDAIGRERLVYHELCHLQQKRGAGGDLTFDKEGRPVLALVPHDYEFFDAEVRRYGPTVCGKQGALEALKEGKRRPHVRGRGALQLAG